MQPDILDFALKIKQAGFGGSWIQTERTVGFRKMIAEKAVDYFAMDIKTSPSRYGGNRGG